MSTPLQTDTFQDVIPMAAVSVVVRYNLDGNSIPSYLLVQRGKDPNKGIWSLPGGKIETGEASLMAAKRELKEETGLCSDFMEGFVLKWCEDAPISTTDSIHFDQEDRVQFHYVISQWFAEIVPFENSQKQVLPSLNASDDAEDISWWSLSEVQRGIGLGTVTKGVDKVLIRTELMYERKLL